MFSIPKFFHPGSVSKNLSNLTKKKLVSKLFGNTAGLFIPDPDPVFYPSGSGGQKKGTGFRIRNTDCKCNLFSVQDSQCDGGYSEPGRSGPGAAAVGARAAAASATERYSARAAAASAYERDSAPRHQSQLPR
jgi:hypothetical protein